MVLEYEDVLRRATDLGEEEVLTILRFLCSVAHRQKIAAAERFGIRAVTPKAFLDVIGG